jgi:mercuric ion binding protein
MKQLTIFMLGLVVTFFLAGPTSAQLTEVSLRVDGLACPFCAYGLEKKLKRIDNLEKLDIKINEGLVILSFKEGAKIDKELISKKVKEAGFTPKELQIKGEPKEIAKTQDGSKENKIVLNIEGMSCEGCVSKVKTTLSNLDCVKDVEVEFSTEKATFICADENVDQAKFIKAIEKLGFKAKMADTGSK